MTNSTVFFIAILFLSSLAQARPIFPGEPRLTSKRCELNLGQALNQIKKAYAWAADLGSEAWQHLDLNKILSWKTSKEGTLIGMRVMLQVRDTQAHKYGIFHGYIYAVEREMGEARPITARELRDMPGATADSMVQPHKTFLILTDVQPLFEMDNSQGYTRWVSPRWPKNVAEHSISIQLKDVVSAQFLPR